MKLHKYFRKSYWLLSALFLSLLLFPAPNTAQAQEDLPQNLIRKVGFEQKLDAQLPLNLKFTDSHGQAVKLSRYFNDKPVILALGYYECPMLCSMVRSGLVASLKELDFTVGQEFDVVIVSIDPQETTKVAEMKRRASMMDYGRSDTDEGWHFLIGSEESVQTLADRVGFRYAYDKNLDQYVHPSGIMVVTPEGRISHYFFGIDFPERDLRLSLVEASESQIGSPVDLLLLTCYHYDPVSGEYTLAIMNIIRIAGSLTVLVIGVLLYKLLRSDKKQTMLPQSS
ncbi:MAG TPA: SCO family protein [Anaerolineae bacterium]|nr:SCO family protein [Anaerolineae bacterium]HMR62787.1 SCO family protein [Anaerolineae bacterium]